MGKLEEISSVALLSPVCVCGASISTVQLQLNELIREHLLTLSSLDTCAKKIPLVSMGGKRRVKRAQTCERGQEIGVKQNLCVEKIPLVSMGGRA